MPLDHFVDLPSCEKSSRHLKSLRHLTSIGAQSKSEEYVATERAMEKVRSQASFFGARFPGRCLRPDGGGRDDLVRRLLFSARVFEKLW